MMEYNTSVLKRSALFSGVEESKIPVMLDCLGAKKVSYNNGEYVLRQGEYIDSVCVLLSGRLHIRNEDYWGNGSILGRIEPGDMFAEAYSVPGSGALLNDVTAVEDCEVLFLDVKKIFSQGECSCGFHGIIIKNLVYEISEKNRNLVAKLGYMSKRTIREKLIAYLSDESKKQNRPSFEIPFNRQQLADFLSVDRSAMSKELGKMKNDGLIEFDKNRFILK